MEQSSSPPKILIADDNPTNLNVLFEYLSAQGYRVLVAEDGTGAIEQAVLYLLIVIGTVVSALVVTIVAFKASVVFGILMLVFGDPLFILIVLAIYRIILEFFVVTFRVAEDVRALRERREMS